MIREEISNIQLELLRSAMQLESFDSLAAAEQYLRTQVHPQLYSSIQQLQAIIDGETIEFKRRVCDAVGYHHLPQSFSHAEPLVAQYQRGGAYAHRHTDDYVATLILAAFFDTQLLHELTTAVIAEKASQRLTHRFNEMDDISHSFFAREMDELHHHAAATYPKTAHKVVHSHAMRPLFVEIGDDTIDAKHYRVDGVVDLLDPINQYHGVRFSEAVEAQTYHIDQQLSIPLERAKKGMLLRLSLKEMDSIRRHPTEMYFSPKQVDQLRMKGSAVRTRIGLRGDVRIHPEYFGELGMDRLNSLPPHDIASVRVRKDVLDIKRLDTDAILTVLV